MGPSCRADGVEVCQCRADGAEAGVGPSCRADGVEVCGRGVPGLGAKAGRTNGAEACQDEGCAGMWGGGMPCHVGTVGQVACRDVGRRRAGPMGWEGWWLGGGFLLACTTGP